MPSIRIDLIVDDKGTVKIKQFAKTAEDAGRRAENAFDKAGGSVGRTSSSFLALTGNVLKAAPAFAVATAAITGVYTALGKIRDEFTGGLAAIEKYHLSVASMAAFMTTFSEKAAGGNIAGAYKDATNYAEKLVNRMEVLDARTIATGHDLLTINETLIKGGVLIDINNKEQEQGFLNIVNATKLLTAGQNQEIQLRQEIRALTTGAVLQGNQLVQTLKAIDPLISKHILLWKQQGTLLENVGRLLIGFNPAATALEKTWSAIGTTMETINVRVLRGGMKPVYDDLLKLAVRINRAFMDTEGILTPLALKTQKWMQDTWETIKKVVVETEISVLKLAMLLNKVGGTATAGGMLLTGPGAALGIEGSEKRFKAFFDQNMEYEERWNASFKRLKEIDAEKVKLADPNYLKTIAADREAAAILLERARAGATQPKLTAVSPSGTDSKAADKQRDEFARQLDQLDDYLADEYDKLFKATVEKEDMIYANGLLSADAKNRAIMEVEKKFNDELFEMRTKNVKDIEVWEIEAGQAMTDWWQVYGEEKIEAERAMAEESIKIEVEKAEKLGQIWWENAQRYISFAQMMATDSVAFMLAEGGERENIGRKMLATAIRFMTQELQLYFFKEAKKKVFAAAADAAQIAGMGTVAAADMSIGAARAAAWATYYAAHAANPAGAAIYSTSATLMTAAMGAFGAAGVAATGLAAAGVQSNLLAAAGYAAAGIAVGVIGENLASSIEGNTSGIKTASSGSSFESGGVGTSVDSSLLGATATAESPWSPSINIYVYGNIVDQDAFARELVPSITKAIADGVH